MKLKRKGTLSVIMLVMLLLLFACNFLLGQANDKQSGELLVQFLDVGQADCILIQNGNESMLIDAGNNEDEEFILSYLKEKGVTELKYAVGTHSHEDHIGSMDSVLKSVKTAQIILPEEQAQTKTYKDVLTAVKSQRVKLIRPVIGDKYELGDAEFTIIAPLESRYTDTNDYSVGILLQYGNTRFLFTGDASEKAEKEMISTGIDLKVDVLKAGHHGSSDSNSQKFLDEADPSYAVISCGTDNKYGHPHAEAVARFEDSDIQIYRTDKQGTITAVSDGSSIHFKVSNSIALEENREDKKTSYVLNKNTKKFHLPNCKSVKTISSRNKEIRKETRKNLREMGYSPCKQCKP